MSALFTWDFSNGTLNNLNKSGLGTVTVQQIGATYYAHCLTPSDRAEAVNLAYAVPEQQSIRAVVDVSFEQLPQNLWEILYCLRITHSSRYGGSHPVILGVQLRNTGLVWRLEYYNTGAIFSQLFYSPPINSGQRYRVELTLSAGPNSAITLVIDGVTIATVSPVDNSGIVSALNSVDFGIPWGPANAALNDYYLEINGVGVTYYTISGLVKDSETMQPIAGAGIIVGTVGLATDANGFFSIIVPAGIYDIKVMRTGYQTVNIMGVDTTLTDVNLGDITLIPTIQNIYWQIRALTMFPYWFAYTEDAYNQCLRDTKQLFGNRVNFIDLRVIWHADPTDGNNVVLYPDLGTTGRTSLESLAVAIDRAHANGFAVLLGIIHDNFNDPNWAVFPTPVPPVTDWTLWWQNYQTFVSTIAQWAQQHGVEALILGWEYDFMTVDRAFENGTYNLQWGNLLSAVRNIYKGLLAYEASHPWNTQLQQEILLNDWWSNLDFIDFSTYPPLTNLLDPTLAQLAQGWISGPLGVDYIQIYRQIAAHYGKKIVINTAYPSYDGANITPWKGTTVGAPDWEEQRICWEAFFLAWEKEDLAGVHIEHFDNIPQASDMTSGIREKPAAYTINQALANLTPPTTPPSPLIMILIAVALVFSLNLLTSE